MRAVATTIPAIFSRWTSLATAPRIPLIVVSPYSLGGHVKHSYTDHVSILKFIEANWGLPTISSRSRDNLPNPEQINGSYAPMNTPAIGDLMDMFDFSKRTD